MALQLNLLHEEITQERQRKRDPLKLGVLALCVFGAILFIYYGWNAYRTLQIKSQLNAAQAPVRFSKMYCTLVVELNF